MVMDYINRLLSMGQTTTTIPGTGFSDWSTWSTCTATCGTTGLKLRTRVCLLGRTCLGSTQENAACTADPCTNTGASTVITSSKPASDTEASTVITSSKPASVTESSSARTMPISTSVPCEDNEVGLQGTCAYWQNFDVCKPDSDAYLGIAKSHCRKTCGICG
ncbi:hypothetical protein CHS0354_042243 [Potamilus streckersoni]|uniref:ShKT domain-containing protein n=1 Tax=Potamilus streckersoni TaxID=2493646 RepID=A0AAE0STN7_9BIVA|nr:hypothetical protein CHS0354_042243 [Potamilus streckersoni]